MSSAEVHANCRAACRTRLLTVTGLPDSDHQAWEGFRFQPVVGEAFVEDKLIAVASTPVAIGAIDHGISYVVTLKFPADEGTADIEELAGAILDAFKVGTKLTQDGQTFLCYKAERRGAIVQEVDWQILTVVADLQVFTTE